MALLGLIAGILALIVTAAIISQKASEKADARRNSLSNEVMNLESQRYKLEEEMSRYETSIELLECNFLTREEEIRVLQSRLKKLERRL